MVMQCNSRLSCPPGEYLDVTICGCALNCLRQESGDWTIYQQQSTVKLRDTVDV